MSADALCEQASWAEELGFASFFLPESHFVAATSMPDPLLLLAAVAARTRSIQLGTTSWLLPIRQPLLAAEQVAVLDHLCGGRLILGLGRGFQPGMLDAFGVREADKRDRFGAILTAMQAAWRGEPIGAPEHGQQLSPLPLQQPHPPLWVAAFGPKAIAQVGSLGLPYLASPMESRAELQANYARHREAVSAQGLDYPDIVAVMRTVFVSEDAARCQVVRDKLASLPAPPLRRGDQPAVEDWCLVGSTTQVHEAIEAYREQLGMTHLVAVRPRVAGIEESWLRDSLATLAAMPVTE
jgi:alkanesulfonate monooxygenase SsuD/methylene tetrahydromethanopterin reductase-like flavin-dependent oxidoreductase (luciferase family)